MAEQKKQLKWQELKREGACQAEFCSILTECAITKPISQTQSFFSTWLEYPPITVDIKHSSFHLLKGTAAGQSVAYSVCEGPIFHFGVIRCSKRKFFLSFVTHFLHLGVQSQYAGMRTACKVLLCTSTLLKRAYLFPCTLVKSI